MRPGRPRLIFFLVGTVLILMSALIGSNQPILFNVTLNVGVTILAIVVVDYIWVTSEASPCRSRSDSWPPSIK